MIVPDTDLSTRVEEAAERIFQSGILDEIAAEAVDGTLVDRDVMADAIAIASLALDKDKHGAA